MKYPQAFALFLLTFLLGSCFPSRSYYLTYPDAKDLRRFESREIRAGETCFEFHSKTANKSPQLKVDDWTGDLPDFITLDSFAQHKQIRSLLVIQRDTLLFEHYRSPLNAGSLHPSYSIAKSFTSALLGIAIAEGYIESVEEPALKYLPELKGKKFAKQLTIDHLLNHTSGLHQSLHTDAIIYYGRNSLKAFSSIKFDHPPGQQQHYLNINIELLGLILNRATGIPPAKYLEEKIWQPIGMCSDGLWSVDEKNQLEKTYCCLGATALDYAKFARLYLHEGIWEGERLIPESWYQQSISRDTSAGSSFNYNHSWHIGLKEYGDFMAIGLYKQHLYINPEKELIIVVLNDRDKPLRAERVNWWFVFRQIADQL